MTTASAELYLRALSDEKRTADFVASTSAEDAYGDVVEQVWQLERYKSNPVVLYAHNSRELPIGQCTRCAVVKGQLECTILFASAAANPLAENVWQSIKEKSLRAVSVGFVPDEVRVEKHDGREVYVLSKNTLHEISVVPIPANQEALAKMRARALQETTTMTTADENKERAALETKDRELVEAKKSLDAARATEGDLKTKLAAAVTERDALKKERDAALEVAKRADLALVERDLVALVGVKITAAEKDILVECASDNRALFVRQLDAIKARPDMTILQSVTPSVTAPPPAATGTDNGAALAALMQRPI